MDERKEKMAKRRPEGFLILPTKRQGETIIKGTKEKGLKSGSTSEGLSFGASITSPTVLDGSPDAVFGTDVACPSYVATSPVVEEEKTHPKQSSPACKKQVVKSFLKVQPVQDFYGRNKVDDPVLWMPRTMVRLLPAPFSLDVQYPVTSLQRRTVRPFPSRVALFAWVVWLLSRLETVSKSLSV